MNLTPEPSRLASGLDLDPGAESTPNQPNHCDCPQPSQRVQFIPGQTNRPTGCSSRSEPVTTFGTKAGWAQEHLWPNGHGINYIEPAYSDLFNLRPIDATVNSSRGDKYYDVSDPSNYRYRKPAHPEAPDTSTDSDSWEPPDSVKGDVARALLYMAVRYTGDAPNEPRLTLTDKTNEIVSEGALMGHYTTVFKWHFADPVSAAERTRNDGVYGFQANRNPFIDHPERVTAALVPPLAITRSGTNVWLCWTNDYVPSMVVEESTNLVSGWSLATNARSLTSTNTWTITKGLPDETRFFRLRLK